ncbi:TetR/AcrR family transcriptional regulator [Nocardioides insulae]|uniref:TetR/AcrR family transcriptional regulator n=1 Tax=Nocardioides insulae TaxID=394734 RepID=UPI00041979A9|nr:TetR/AcrR family transcriptional regulator [Nocardioides insulae]
MAASKPWATREKRDRAESETRAGLVHAAQRVFSREGYARTTIAHITAEAGVSRATFYVYFADKGTAFAVVAEHVRDRMVAAQELTGLDPDDVRAVAEATNAAYLDAYAANLAFITVLEHQSLSDPEMAALWEELHDLPRRRTAGYVARLAAQGRANPAASPDAVARAGGGMVAQFAPLVTQDPTRRTEIIADLTAMFLRLLGVDPEE